MEQQSRALVTGAGRRVGHHVATRLLQDGYEVLAVSRRATPELDALEKRGALVSLVDLTDAPAIQGLAREMDTFLEGMTLLVNNASVFGPTPQAPEDIARDFEQYFRIHMLAPYLLGEAFARACAGDVDRCIVNITDIFAARPSPTFDIYCATKAALANLTISQSLRYAPRIRANAIAPGPVLWADHHDEPTKDAILAQTPLRREGGAQSIYGAVRYLANASFVTGVTVRVDGGRMHAYAPSLDP